MRITVDFLDDGYGKHYIVATLPDGTEIDSVCTSYPDQHAAVTAFLGALASIDMKAETPPDYGELVDPAIWPRLTEQIKAMRKVEEDEFSPDPEPDF